MTPPLRWGIASAGKISNDFCAALSTLPAEHHQVVAVAARSEDAAKEFAERFNIAKYYGGYDKLAADDDVGMWAFHTNEILNYKVLRQCKETK